MNRLVTVLIVLTLIITGAYFIFTSETRPNDLAPSFSLEDYSGVVVSSSNFDGTIQVINVWSSWCPFCVKELPDFVRLQKEFPDIAVIAINRGESLETAKDFTDNLGISDRMTFLVDEESSYYKSIGGFSMPETLFVDEDGNIFLHKRGPMTFEEMKEIINQIK